MKNKVIKFVVFNLIVGQLILVAPAVSLATDELGTETSHVETNVTQYNEELEDSSSISTEVTSEGVVNSEESTEISENSEQLEVESQEVVPEVMMESSSEEIVEELEEELIEYDFGLPSGRSDLESATLDMYAQTRAGAVSITDKNKPTANFIDVSSHNGNLTVEHYKTIKKYGVTGVVVKLTEGTSYVNPYAKSQIQNAKAAGLTVSAYHYSWFKDGSQAAAEARFFANEAVKLGLPKSTVMVNDIEDGKLKALKNNTSNSLAFAKELNNQGFSKVTHYLGLHWITEKAIDPYQLGMDKIWVAAYPYNPSAQLYKQYGAWQWSSKMTFPGVPGNFDISSDYMGTYSTKTQLTQGKYIADGRYVSITSGNYPIYSNFDWKERGQTNSIYNKTYEAKGRYKHGNGNTYFSLYDGKGKWVGYVDQNATKIATHKGGVFIADGGYATVTSKSYDTFANFYGTKKSKSVDMYQQTFLVKGQYNHVGGATYYSLYDAKGNWYGHINKNATRRGDGKQGAYISDGRQVTVNKKGVAIWSNFNWKKKKTSDSIYNQKFIAKGRYEHMNGATYYSLYNSKGVWQGYINAGGVK